jgi:hypothetical protein
MRENSTLLETPLSDEIISYIVFGVGLAGFIWVVGMLREHSSSMRRLEKLVRSTPLVKIGLASPGYQAVKGRLHAKGEVLKCPVSGARCVTYHVKLEYHEGSGDSGIGASFVANH